MSRLLTSLGYVVITLGVACHHSVVSFLFSGDGDLEGSTRALIYILQGLAIVSGLVLVRHRQAVPIVVGVLRRVQFNEYVFLGAFGGWIAGFVYWTGNNDFNTLAAHGHPLFPGVLDLPATIFVAAGLPLGAMWLVATSVGRQDRQRRYAWVGGLLVLTSLVSVWHSDRYSDAAGVVHFWTALWIWWFGANIGRTDEGLYTHGVTLGHAVIGLMFLGGAVGKWTADYWMGTATYELLFRSSQVNPFASLARQLLAPEGQMTLATVLGRATVVSESILALSVLLPTRVLVWFALVTWLGMVTTVSVTLVDLLFPLIGLLTSCWLLDRRLRGMAIPFQRIGVTARLATEVA
jgi:hypothetical protein